jgi:hypothetical protein
VSCRHNPTPLADRPFQVKQGAAWQVSFCNKCGVMLDFVARNPHHNEPMVDQVQEAA